VGVAFREPLRQFLQRRGGLAAGQAEPLHREELLRHPRADIARVVDHDRHEKHHVVGHVQRALDGELPLAAEVAFAACLGARRDDRHEIRAGADLVAQLGIPGLAAGELVLVEPDLEARGCESVAQRARRGPVSRGIADEDRVERRRGVWGITRHGAGKITPGRTPVKLRPSPDVGSLIDYQRAQAVLKT
jgi:hypothetical protein